MRKLKIAIVDDGIDQNYNIFGTEIQYLFLENEIFKKEPFHEEYAILTHGTICSIIFSYFTREIYKECYSLKIVDLYTQKSTMHNLVLAIEWAIVQKIDIILLSLGSTNYFDFKGIEEVVKRADNKGIIMIAACNNKNIFTFPAALPEVIGVRYDYSNILPDGDYHIHNYDIGNIDITVNSKCLMLEEESKLKIDYSNSFAVPYIASLVADELKSQRLNKMDIMKHLLEKSNQNNRIDTFEYIKKGMLEWNEEIDVPIIGFPVLEESLFENVVHEFQKKGYKAILLLRELRNFGWNNLNIKKIEDKYECNNKEAIQLVLNVFDPDIIFISCIKEIKDSEEAIIDMKISSKESSGWNYSGSELSDIVEKIEQNFC